MVKDSTDECLPKAMCHMGTQGVPFSPGLWHIDWHINKNESNNSLGSLPWKRWGISAPGWGPPAVVIFSGDISVSITANWLSPGWGHQPSHGGSRDSPAPQPSAATSSLSAHGRICVSFTCSSKIMDKINANILSHFWDISGPGWLEIKSKADGEERQWMPRRGPTNGGPVTQ